MSDHVQLRIPATTGHIALARATATALAARLDFTYDRLTDLHIAIDEASGRVLAASEPASRRLEVTFRVDEAGLEVTITGDGGLREDMEFLNPWSRLILESIAGSVDVSANGDLSLRFLVRLGGPV